MKVFQQFSRLELLDGCYHPILITLAEAVVKGQPEQPLAFLFAHRTTSGPASHALAHGRKVERHIMKHAENALRL